jgi:hypothetical protein
VQPAVALASRLKSEAIEWHQEVSALDSQSLSVLLPSWWQAVSDNTLAVASQALYLAPYRVQ